MSTLPAFAAQPVSVGRPAADAAARFDLYATTHKAIRVALSDTLGRLGRLDLNDEVEVAATGAQLDGLLRLLDAHTAVEGDFVHAAIEARRAGGGAALAPTHEDPLASIEALRAELSALGAARGAERRTHARRLYQHLALFVAERLQRMHHEETRGNQLLWTLYGDAELASLHEHLLTQFAPSDLVVALRWMAVALNPDELARMLAGLRQKGSPEAFVGTLELVRAHAPDARWIKVGRDLAPGCATGDAR